jgi:hypothetical protein
LNGPLSLALQSVLELEYLAIEIVIAKPEVSDLIPQVYDLFLQLLLALLIHRKCMIRILPSILLVDMDFQARYRAAAAVVVAVAALFFMWFKKS